MAKTGGPRAPKVAKAPARPTRRQVSRSARPAAKTGGKAPATAKGAPSRTAPRRAVGAAAKPEPVLRAKPETLRLRSIGASLTVGDLERSLTLYTKGFGFIVHQRWESDGRLEGVTLLAGTCELNLAQDDGAKGFDRQKGEGLRLWLETVQDLDLIAERAESYGAVITSWPEDREWGVRSFSADDLDGYHLSFYRKLG